MDAADVISKRGGEVPSSVGVVTLIKDGKVLVKMKSAGGSWTTPNGVRFSKEQPFQVVDFFEAEALISGNPDRFCEGDPDEAKVFYGVK